MIVIMKNGATQEQVNVVIERVKKEGLNKPMEWDR